jgi:hypothetical protein
MTPSSPESFTEACCTKNYEVPYTKSLTLVGAGRDPEGVSRVRINFEITRNCENGTDLAQRLHATGILAVTPGKTPSPGGSVSTELLASGNFSLADEAPSCHAEYPLTTSVSGLVWVDADNYFGGSRSTVEVTFTAIKSSIPPP